MKIRFKKQHGSKYLIMYLKSAWRKIGKDKVGNWFCAIGDNTGTKRAYHSCSLINVIIKSLRIG
jgi:hypothetical protein